MHRALRRLIASVVALVSLCHTATHAQPTPLATAFTYQGELAAAGTPATATYDLRFRLYDAAAAGTQIGSTLCSDNLAVSAGRFAASLDFGDVFTGQKRFLEIEVRQDTGLGCGDATGYTVLSPRQELTATPNATFAQTAATATTATIAASLNGQSPSFYQNAANLTGTLADAQLSGNVARLNGDQTFTGLLNFTNAGNTFAGNGAGLTNLSGASINAGTLGRSSLSADVQSGVGTLVLDSLSLAGTVATFNRPNSVAVSGSFAYAVSNTSTLQVFNISNPAVPTVAATVATGSGPFFVAVSGSFAYVVNYTSNTLQIFNISNPAAPTLAGSVATGFNPYSVAVSGPFAYVVNYNSNSLQVFNVSNPAAPTLAGSVTTGSQPTSVAVSGSRAYVVNYSSNTLQVFNISNPAAPTLAGSVATGSQPRCVAVSGSLAYVVNYVSNTLQLFNISNSAAPMLAGNVATGSFPISVAVSGSSAYVVNYSSNSLQVFNISSPAAPTLAGTVATGSGPWSVAVSGSIVSVANQSSNTLQVFNTLGVGFSTPLAASSLPSTVARTNTANAFGNFTNTFAGNVSVIGTLSKGGGSFKIDHPLDPENKYLYHSFVESPDMMNVYNGNITTDGQGYATITLSDYFEALNRDFRYQLTVIDENDDMEVFLWAKVVKKINGNQFTIRSSRGNLEVSWQVTGIRRDAWAEKNRIPNSVNKPAAEKGKLLHPEAFGKSAEQGVHTMPAASGDPESK